MRSNVDKPAEGERVTESSQPTSADEDQRPLSSYLVGPFLDDALGKDESNSIDVFWPFEEDASKQNRSRVDKVDWRGREAILYASFALSLAFLTMPFPDTTYLRISSVNHHVKT